MRTTHDTIRIAHLLDASTCWEQRVGVSRLADRLSVEKFDQVVLAIHPAASAAMRPAPLNVRTITRLGRYPVLAGPSVARVLRHESIDLVHAWGLDAALAARAAGAGRIVLSLSTPALSRRDAKLIRTLTATPGLAVACGSETVKRRAVEAGVDASACIIVRPGVDFHHINRVKAGSLRADLGVARDDILVVLAPCDDPRLENFDAFWASRLAGVLDGHMHVAIPSDGRRRRRLARFDRIVTGTPVLIERTRGLAFEQLVAIADVFVIASRTDVSTTAVAWAMAAGAAVIGSAVYSIAELIGNGLNGRLFKANATGSLAPAIYRCLMDRAEFPKLVDVARGHAYEVFGLRRCMDQHARLYQNLHAGRPPDDGIVDSAVR